MNIKKIYIWLIAQQQPTIHPTNTKLKLYKKKKKKLQIIIFKVKVKDAKC